MYFWQCYAVWMLQAYMIGASIEMLLTPRIKRNKWLCALFFASVYAIPSYFKLATTGTDNQILYQISNMVGFFWVPVYIFFGHRDKAKEKLLCFAVMLISMFITYWLFTQIIKLNNIGNFFVDFDSAVYFREFLIVNGFQTVTLFFFAFLVKAYNNKDSIKKHSLRLSLFALSQLIVLYFLTSLSSLPDYSYVNMTSSYGVFGGYMADLILIFIMDRQSEQETVRRELRMLQKKMELDKIQYEALQLRRQALAKLRHDYNNQLIVVQLLLESGNESEAYEISFGLKKHLENSTL